MKNAVCILVILAAVPCRARIITVDDDAPADFTTIQAAIDDANDGDTVEIQPGTYTGDGNRDIDFLGKAITVTSTDPNDPNTVANTLIDCNGTGEHPHRGFWFQTDEDENSVLSGLTITNGYIHNSAGGAIYCDDAWPTIRNCIITGNYASDGGAICGASGEIANCIISNNRARSWGGGLFLCSGPIRNCIIINNSADGTYYAEGGGLRSCNGITNCTIAFNSSRDEGGGLSRCDSIVNCVVYYNSAGSGPNGVYDCSDLRYSCLQNGTGPGCINSDPMLAPDGYHLLPGSPCINAGDPNGSFITQTDIDGEPRIMGSSIEMGADEFTADVLLPVALEITGRGEVRSGYSAQYLAMALYEDGPARFVTDGMIFWVSPPEYGTIDNNGFLASVPQDTAHDITIHAQYNEGGVTVEADFVVHMYVTPHVLSVPDEFATIQEAMDAAGAGDTIILQPGTYTGPGNYNVDFLGRAITVRSTDPNDPCTVAGTIIDCSSSGNAFQFQTGEDANSVLDGLTLTSYGQPAVSITDSAPTIRNCTMTDNYEHAIYCEGSDGLTIANCLFVDNYVGYVGGAIVFDETAATLTDCIFSGNFTLEPRGRSGGAIRAYSSTLKFAGCVFEDNRAQTYGGAMNADDCQLDFTNCLFISCLAPGGAALSGYRNRMTLANCQFIGNSNAYAFRTQSHRFGGTVFSGGGDLSVTNCLFAGHYAGNVSSPAGALLVARSDVSIENCTFSDNYSSAEGNALVVNEDLYGYADYPSNIHVENSVIWDGSDSIVIEDDTVLLVSFSDIPCTVPGYGNIYADPCFVDPGCWVDSRDPNIIVEPNHSHAAWVHGDYHVKSQAGRWDPNEGRWTIDEVTSPCIDGGDPNSPICLEPFPNGGIVNMGAYGGTTEASKSYFGGPACETIVAGDINGDCVVNGLDFSLMAAHWLGRRICPAVPSSPNPPDNAEDVPLSQLLTWRPSCDATSYRIYFGTDSPGRYQGRQETLLFDPGTLEYNTTYYWHIVETTPEGSFTGPTWTFQTPFRRDPASNPDPCDGETGVGTRPILTWTAGIGAESHDVYFGDTDPPEFQGNQVNTYYEAHLPSECNDPRRCPYPDLEFSTRYYWRIDEVNPYGTTTGAMWTFRTGCPPTQAADPNPPDDANDVGASVVLSWTRDVNATSQNVYFGTADPPEYQGSQTETTFTPASLAPATTYYWRIDQINSLGTTTGEMWTFTTGTTPPGQATNPSPADDANNLDPGIVLSWSAGSDALSHDVYFGTTSPGTFRSNQAETTFNPGSLSPGTAYYWRIDEVGYFGTTTGAVWTFTTRPLPDPPTNPDPVDGAIDVGLNPILSWTGGAGAESYDIYFGTMWDYRNRGNQTETTFDPGTLSPGTQYYWRIGEINIWGTTYGPEWTFTTQAAK